MGRSQSRALGRLLRCMLLGLLVWLLVGSGAVVTAQPAPPESPPAPAPSQHTEQPVVEARAAVLIEASTGRVLFSKQAHERLPPASLTKMVTAMVALEKGAPDQTIVATERSMAEPSVIGLDPGDRLPLTVALHGLLLNSGNDAGLAIAETVGNGSIERFVGWMNAMVSGLGLTDTRFANPHGLDIGEHYSTAYDMAVIARVMMREPLLRTMVATPRYQYEGPALWVFRNINPFLTEYPGADGIKTGYETRAGRCLAASATREGRQLITVVLNSEEYVQDTVTLMDYGFSRLSQLDSAFSADRRLDQHGTDAATTWATRVATSPWLTHAPRTSGAWRPMVGDGGQSGGQALAVSDLRLASSPASIVQYTGR